MILNPSFFEALMERILRFYMEFMEKFLAAAARRVDFLRIGDDFGTQRGLLVQEEHLRRFIQPALKALAVLARRHGARYYHHSCGAVRPLIPFFIETGVDVLDPLQVRATGMNPAELKAEFGRSIAFSGGVDEQELLPRGTPGEVRRGVRELLETMAPGGGFFLGPTHNFQLDIPTANIVAMYQAAREWKP
jgi:uroporphyrinogen decarboxylase